MIVPVQPCYSRPCHVVVLADPHHCSALCSAPNSIIGCFCPNLGICAPYSSKSVSMPCTLLPHNSLRTQSCTSWCSITQGCHSLHKPVESSFTQYKRKQTRICCHSTDVTVQQLNWQDSGRCRRPDRWHRCMYQPQAIGAALGMIRIFETTLRTNLRCVLTLRYHLYLYLLSKPGRNRPPPTRAVRPNMLGDVRHVPPDAQSQRRFTHFVPLHEIQYTN